MSISMQDMKSSLKRKAPMGRNKKLASRHPQGFKLYSVLLTKGDGSALPGWFIFCPGYLLDNTQPLYVDFRIGSVIHIHLTHNL